MKRLIFISTVLSVAAVHASTIDYCAVDPPAGIDNISIGSLFELKCDELTKDAAGDDFTDDFFSRKPRVLAYCRDPQDGVGSLRVRRRVFRIFDFKLTESRRVVCKCRRRLKLYNRRLIKRSQAAAEYIPVSQQGDLTLELRVRTRDSVGDKGLFEAGTIALKSPEINAVYAEDGVTPIVSAKAGDIIFVEGNYLGTKIPKVWMEQTVATRRGDRIRREKCEVLEPLRFIDEMGRMGRSCMDLSSITGHSVVRIKLPNRFRRNWDAASTDHNIVIDNGIGRATIAFTTD